MMAKILRVVEVSRETYNEFHNDPKNDLDYMDQHYGTFWVGKFVGLTEISEDHSFDVGITNGQGNWHISGCDGATRSHYGNTWIGHNNTIMILGVSYDHSDPMVDGRKPNDFDDSNKHNDRMMGYMGRYRALQYYADKSQECTFVLVNHV